MYIQVIYTPCAPAADAAVSVAVINKNLKRRRRGNDLLRVAAALPFSIAQAQSQIIVKGVYHNNSFIFMLYTLNRYTAVAVYTTRADVYIYMCELRLK